MNKEIKKILLKLEREGYEAYIVGGYVRDKVLGKVSYDIDICTNALPKDLHSIFPHTSSNEYGGFNFNIKDFNIDITTYRKELRYEGRKPTEIKYINNLLEDLKRRDFTMNTLCMNTKGKIIDLLNGKEDIKSRMIKMLGDCDNKVIEDPLRILRAVRFACTLNFNIDDELKNTLYKYRHLVKTLSNERVRLELNKILLTKNYMYGLNLLKELHLLEELNISYTDIKYSNDLLIMWSQIKCDNKLFTKSESNNIIKMRQIIKDGIISENTLYKYGLYLCMVTGEILGYSKKDIYKMYNNMGVNEVKILDITSEEIMEILNINPSKEIKIIKEELIKLILEKKLINKKEKIINYLKNRK